MPLYEYECESCGQSVEKIQKFSDPPLGICPTCGGRLQKLLSSPAIQFKGSGWYITDYAKKPSADTASGATKNPGDGAGDSEGKKRDSEAKKTEPSSTPSSAEAAKKTSS